MVRKPVLLHIVATATTRCAMLPCKVHDVYWPTSLQQLLISIYKCCTMPGQEELSYVIFIPGVNCCYLVYLCSCRC